LYQITHWRFKILAENGDGMRITKQIMQRPVPVHNAYKDLLNLILQIKYYLQNTKIEERKYRFDGRRHR